MGKAQEEGMHSPSVRKRLEREDLARKTREEIRRKEVIRTLRIELERWKASTLTWREKYVERGMEIQRFKAEIRDARTYAKNLLKSLAPEVEPLETTDGLLSQIDNAITGLLTKKEE